jgi:hypothetical protein
MVVRARGPFDKLRAVSKVEPRLAPTRRAEVMATPSSSQHDDITLIVIDAV